MAAEKKAGKRVARKPPIFSGDHSTEMWDLINNARTVHGLRDALYVVCCRLQEMESELSKRIKWEHDRP